MTTRTVLITGAGGGVGRGVALACAAAGMRVIVATPRPNGQETVDLIGERGGDARWVPCDVMSRADVELAVASAERLDAIVHNATSRRSSEPQRVEAATLDEWDDHAAVSLRGAYYCAQAAFEKLRATSGRCVFMTSPAGMEGSLTLPLYGMVKAAVRGLAKSLAREWGPHNVTIACVSPLAQTDAMSRAFDLDPALQARVEARIPLQRLGNPELDIGPVVAFLVGGAARYITGQTLVVDGGRYLGL